MFEEKRNGEQNNKIRILCYYEDLNKDLTCNEVQMAIHKAKLGKQLELKIYQMRY